VAVTGFRPDLSWLSELRLELDPTLQAPVALAPLIDPNVHSCGTVYPHGVRELSHPEVGVFLVGMKSYGRAPTFLAMTGYEQVRSVAAAIAGDTEAARRVELTLPETGVCGGSGQFDTDGGGAGGCCAPATPELLPIGRLGQSRVDSPRGTPRRALVTLCVTEVTSWGVRYYAFPVRAPSISADTGWSIAAVTAGFSLGLVVAAVAGVPVWRLLDRYGASSWAIPRPNPRGSNRSGSQTALPPLAGEDSRGGT
jgi:hypothetical protein